MRREILGEKLKDESPFLAFHGLSVILLDRLYGGVDGVAGEV